MKAYLLDVIREIRHSFGRFFSILAIVAIGTAFFAGINASVPDMKYTADQYFKEYQLMDIRMISTMGFSKEDVKAIQECKDIEGILPTYSMDFLTHYKTQQYVIKAIAIHDLKQNDPNNINQMRLISGRMPNKENECVIEEQELVKRGFEIGDTITLESGKEEPITNYLKNNTYQIVGTVYTPDYLSYEKGTSNIGSGKVDLFIGINVSNFVGEYCSEVLIRVKNADQYNSYTDAYFDVINPVTAALNQIGETRSDIRYQEIKKLAQSKFDEKVKQYEQAKLKYDEEIKRGEQKLTEAKDQILLGKSQLESAKMNLTSTITMTKLQIAQNEANISQYETQLKDVTMLQQQMHQQYDPSITQAKIKIEEKQKEEVKLQEQLKNTNLSDEEKQTLTIQLQLVQEEIKQLQNGIHHSMSIVGKIDEKVIYFQNMLKESKQALKQAKRDVTEKEKISRLQFGKTEKELEVAQQKYETGILELEKQKSLGKQELSLAKEKLDKGKAQLETLPQPTWYVLDRNSHYAYRDYKSVTERMDGIAKVFPVFFLLVCALVCLTTMTRMVDEQRGMIGTYKALGYSKVWIAMKYVIYALLAGISGSVLGCVIGMYLFPTVIFEAWNIMYNLPELKFELQLSIALKASLTVITVTILSTIIACYHELVEVPALLMRPKAPKNGKRIVLEKMPFLWKHFSFTQKVTARNIFRYKKRFFMTIIGISGCTSLLVAGFGIQDSIKEIVNKQYNEITKYDSMLTFQSDSTYQARDEVESKLKKDPLIKSQVGVMNKNVTINVEGEETSVMMIVPQDSTVFSDFVQMKNRTSQELLQFRNDGAIISEKLSKQLKVSVGNQIPVVFENGQVKEVKISGIMENYVGHTMYLNPSYYKQLSGERTVVNAYYLKMKQVNQVNESTLGNRYMKYDSVSSMAFYSHVASSFEDTISSISFVVYVLVGAAGLLAFVVLYNLTNVNISERMREIATIKVLGFYPNEVASYVYRENMVLTIIGGLCGLVLGIGLHALIMDLAEMPEIMFGRNIELLSFIYSMLLTVLFALIVNIVMYRKLKQIPMVESLKSVE